MKDLNISLPLFAAAKINNSDGDTEETEDGLEGTFPGADSEDWSDDEDEESEIYGEMFGEE